MITPVTPSIPIGSSSIPAINITNKITPTPPSVRPPPSTPSVRPPPSVIPSPPPPPPPSIRPPPSPPSIRPPPSPPSIRPPPSVIPSPPPPPPPSVRPPPSVMPSPPVRPVLPFPEPVLPLVPDTIKLPDNIVIQQKQNANVNPKIKSLDICVEYNNKIWTIINFTWSNDKKIKNIVIESRENSNEIYVIPYYNVDSNTNKLMKRLIKKCIVLLSGSESTSQNVNQDPFNIDNLDPDFIPSIPKLNTLMDEELEEDIVDDWLDNWNDDDDEYDSKNMIDFDVLKENHTGNLILMKKNSEDISLYINILNNLEAFYACIYINKIKKDNILAKSLTKNLSYIIKTEFFKNMFLNAIPIESRFELFGRTETQEELKNVFKTAIRLLLETIKDSALDRIKQNSNFVNYEKCKSIANVEDWTNDIISELYYKEQSLLSQQPLPQQPLPQQPLPQQPLQEYEMTTKL